MNIALWIVAGLLALVFLAAGAMKLTRPKEVLRDQMSWVDDFSQAQVRGIGALELLGAVGLVLPPLVDVAPVLAPLAATGLVLVMAGAVATHVRRGETPVPPLVLGLLALFVAVGRFWIAPF